MKKIAIITARSGSKGLVNKNIIDLCGKPMLAYSIEAAVKSNVFEHVIVSTDSSQYGIISEQYGAEVMYRKIELSDDKATTYMVLEDIIMQLKQGSHLYDYFVLLQPTSPMRTEKHIIEAVELFEKHINSFDFLVSVKNAVDAKVLVNKIEEDGSLKYFNADFANYRRQGYKDYSPNGAIFIAKLEAYLKQKHFYGERSLAYKMSKVDSIDVDDKIDYEFACMCMKKRLQGERI